MTWWVLTFLRNWRSWTTLLAYAVTNTRHHLFIKWSHYQPSRSPIWRVIRGKRTLCGYKYQWDTPIIDEQWESGETWYHTFRFIHLKPWEHIWYYIFTPIGPYGLECQGPLIHIPPPFIPEWPNEVYVATELKGFYYTDSFSGPGDPQPTWTTLNAGLQSLRIYQLCPESLAPDRNQFVIAGDRGARTVYRRQPFVAPEWVPILTNAEACSATGSDFGEICWICDNPNRIGWIYVLFNSEWYTRGTWCLRSPNYGQRWDPVQITNTLFNYEAGNIQAAIRPGGLTYRNDDILYAALNTGLGGHLSLFVSINNGIQWSLADYKGLSVWTPRCTVDPSNQATIYTGAYLGTNAASQLLRSEDYGADLTEIDGTHHFGIRIVPYAAPMWVHPTASSILRVLIDDHLWLSTDYGDFWMTLGPIDPKLRRLHILAAHPNNLYLARDQSAYPPPDPRGFHTIYVSDDETYTLHGKSGPHADQPDGGGDSIPYNCGGVAFDGIMHTIIS